MSTPETLAGCARYAYTHPRTMHVWESRFASLRDLRSASKNDTPPWAKPSPYRAHKPLGPDREEG